MKAFWSHARASKAVACVLIAVLALVISASAASAKGSKAGAWDVCSQFLLERLKAPATADIAEYKDRGTSVSKTGKTYTVIAYVDAENSFGANIRSDYICTVKYVKGRTYRLIDLQIL